MSKPSINFLSQNEIESIHDGSLKVLERTGVKVMSKQALDLLKKAGAKVDYVNEHVSIPKNLVEEALEMAPKTVKYAARNPKYDFVLDKKKTHFCATANPPLMIDGETGECRYSTAEDIIDCLVVADYLNHVDMVWPFGTDLNVPGPMLHILDMYTALLHTGKHFEGDTVTTAEAKYQLEIAAAIVGGKEELKKRPIISMVICTISPLMLDGGMTDASIEYARAGVPVVIYPMPAVGQLSPATMAGTMVVNTAEFLAGLVIQELASPGAPVAWAPSCGTVNYKTGRRKWSPESTLMSLGVGQLARRYGLPTQRGGLGSSSKLLDAQAGYQKAISLIPSLLLTPDVAGGIASLGPGTCLEIMVIDNEIIDYALRYLEGLEVNDDTLALDVIDKVGPGGHFLGEKHTLQHFREGWMPEITDMETFEVWQGKGSKSIAQIAKEKTREILATHKVEPIPQDIQNEVSKILKKAEAELL